MSAAHGHNVVVMEPLQICFGDPQFLFSSFLELVLTSNAQFRFANSSYYVRPTVAKKVEKR